MDREKFLKYFANLPLNSRKEVVLVLAEKGGQQPITWNVAYFEVKNNTPRSGEILEKLKKLELL